MIQSAEDFVNAMGWNIVEKNNSKSSVQRELFPELSEEEEKIVLILQKYPDGIQINALVVEANVPINRMSSLLFEMEMKGLVRALAGGIYRLL